jgi:hypothetical protein
MVIPEGDSHVGGVHTAEVLLSQVVGQECLGVSVHPWR